MLLAGQQWCLVKVAVQGRECQPRVARCHGLQQVLGWVPIGSVQNDKERVSPVEFVLDAFSGHDEVCIGDLCRSERWCA